MLRKSCLLLCVLSLTAFTAAGCGDDDKSSSSTSTPSTPAVTTDAGTDTGSTDSGDTGTPDAAVSAAVEQCKAAIDNNPAVKEEIKPDLQAICEKAANGNAEEVKAATREVCLKVVESSGLPDAALDTAKQACDAAGG